MRSAERWHDAGVREAIYAIQAVPDFPIVPPGRISPCGGPRSPKIGPRPPQDGPRGPPERFLDFCSFQAESAHSLAEESTRRFLGGR